MKELLEKLRKTGTTPSPTFDIEKNCYVLRFGELAEKTIYYTDTPYSEGLNAQGNKRENASNDYIENNVVVRPCIVPN